MSKFTYDDLLPHQTDFINDTTHRYVGLIGGPGSGKSLAAVHKAVKLAFLNPGLHGALMEPTQNMIRGTLLPTIEKVFQEQLGWKERTKKSGRGQYTYVKSNPESLIIHFPQGDTIIYLCGAENHKRLAGKNLAWFIIDEIDMCSSKQIAMDAFKEATKRIRTIGKCTQGCVTTTPEGKQFSHWFFAENAKYLEGPNKGMVRTDRKCYHSKTADNPFVPKSYIQSLRETLPPDEAEAVLNGYWVMHSGNRVYRCFDEKYNVTTKTLTDFPNAILHIGIDFNLGNTNAVISVIQNDLVYVIKEVKADDTPSLIKELQTKYGHWTMREGGIRIYPDVNARKGSQEGALSSLTQLQEAFNTTCIMNGNNPGIMNERVPAVNALFMTQKMVGPNQYVPHRRAFVNMEECPVLARGLLQQGFKNGKPDKDSGLDHCLDAFGYFVFHKYPVPKLGGQIR